MMLKLSLEIILSSLEECLPLMISIIIVTLMAYLVTFELSAHHYNEVRNQQFLN
jgi:hypothetical protein